MSYFPWLIVGIIILTITIWVHRHTYGVTYEHGEYVADLDDPAPFPRWFLLSVAVASFTAVINVVLFLIGVIMWVIFYVDDSIRLGNLPKWFKFVQEFLTKEV